MDTHNLLDRLRCSGRRDWELLVYQLIVAL